MIFIDFSDYIALTFFLLEAVFSLNTENNACRMIKKHISAATAIFDQLESSLPLVCTKVVMVPMISTPKNEPITLPTQPVSSVPPITVAAIACISMPVAC